MIVYTEQMVITHNEPKARQYSKTLIEDGWKKVTEDTTCAVYEKKLYFREVEGEE